MEKAIRILVLVGLVAIVGLGVWMLIQVDRTTSKIDIVNPENLRPQVTPTIYPSSLTVIEGVQSLSRLETASYHIEKVITAESGQGPLGFLFGDKLLLIAYGEVIAGVDLSEIGPADIMTGEGGVVYLRPPSPEVFINTLDNQRTYVYDRRTGAAGMNPQLETAARQEAERLILQAALEDGLLDTAEQNARNVLKSFILGLGFEHVIFVQEMPTPTPTLTPTPGATLTPTPTS
ncbi:MAG: DUF4230 domain-containing protein [Chloroflexi bacterium]|jgi:hypothetical protein|nr:DUF4230 domain-containing protein [Chloroflexota bacterium]